MKIKDRPISELIFAEYNPRELTPDQRQQLKDSLTRFGIVDPVIVNTHKDRKDIIVGGHQRTKVWKEMGNKEIPTIEVNLNPEKERELNIRLNKNSGQWDEQALQEHFNTDELIDWGFDEDYFSEIDITLKKEKKEILPYKNTHILLSFTPEKIIQLQPMLEKILQLDGIEYEQTSN